MNIFNFYLIFHLKPVSFYLFIFVPGWQRVSSYDQASSANSTGRHDTTSNSSLLSSHSRPSSSKPSSSSRPHSRARLSEARAPAPDITNLSNPLFNKTNPMQFLDIMKGVSARLDENAGVRPRKEFNPGSGPSSSRAKKRTRGVSLGGASESQAGKATHGMVKKGRVDEIRTSDTLTWDEGRERGRAMSEDEALDSEMRGRGLQTHSSLPDMPCRSDLRRASKDVSFMDVDERDDDAMVVEDSSRSAVSLSSNHGYPDTRPFARTRSQTEMPPPPLFACDSFVHKQRQPAADPSHQQSNAQSTSTPLAVSRYSNSMNKPQTSHPPPQQPQINHSVKQRKPNAIPKLHPLLYQKPATTRVSSSSTATSAPQVRPQHHPAPIPVSDGLDLKPPPSSITPMFSSTPSSRPPPLGMRRNHTFPSRTSSSLAVQQESSSSLTGGQLPQRQGFKSPLLSLSQPQPQAQTYSLSQPKANANIIVVESDSTMATSRKVSLSSTDNHGFNTVAHTSTALRSSSSSLDSSTSFRSTPPTTSSASSCSHSHSSNSSGYSSSKKSNQGMAQQPQELVVLPEPLDGDADSSFGDMSFDMDALEETMKMYD